MVTPAVSHAAGLACPVSNSTGLAAQREDFSCEPTNFLRLPILFCAVLLLYGMAFSCPCAWADSGSYVADSDASLASWEDDADDLSTFEFYALDQMQSINDFFGQSYELLTEKWPSLFAAFLVLSVLQLAVLLAVFGLLLSMLVTRWWRS